MTRIDLKDAVIKLKDGGGQELEIKIGEGNLTYSEKKSIKYMPDRGLLDDVVEGDEVPMDVSFSFIWQYLKGPSSSSTQPSTGAGAVPTIEDALKQSGAALFWVSTDTDACRPYAVDIEITYAPTPSTCGDQEVILLADFRYEELNHDLRNASVACSGKCNATKAIINRTAQN